MRIALVAGETSGDILGASLIRALRQRFPQATFYGVAGPRMQAAGCEAIESIEALSVMGLAEVLRHLPRLLRLRADLVERFAQDRPDVFVGIDAPDFNLGLEQCLKERGLRTVHMVSPTVWAWRQGRIHGIGRAVDLMLCLFPFEEKIYREHGLRVATIGHPLADELDDAVTPEQGRAALGLPAQAPTVAILPGSRHGELKYLARSFVQAAAWLARRLPETHFVLPVAKPSLRAEIERAVRAHAPDLNWHLLDGQSREAMRAADVVLLASGTATLECLLLGRPMTVSYRTSAPTAWLLVHAGLLKIDRVSLPNLLAAEPVVPELLQGDATPERLGQELWCLLRNPVLRERQLEQFHAVRAALKRDAGALAADAIAELVRA
ncbi:MAG: lipid-A-disaccharide synthase [Gammaproteobacteria bacterium]|nr:lipid-A-disaccharide synthase [Gammaproteobacteria bacterium]